jgi:ribose transport system ATP-binding protein
MAKAALHEVFPENTIDVNAVLSTLSIAQQQMVEIARAISDKNMKLLILDEPTSSLPKRETEYLQEYIKKSSQDGLTYIYISHRLNEVMYLSDYIFIMQNGKRKMYCHVNHTNEEDMVNRMGDTVMKTESDDTFEFPALNETIHVKMDSYSKGMLKDISEAFYGGEIIGISGLEGNGQLELLQSIFTSGVKGKSDMDISGRVAYVAGDRKKEGIFPLWSLYDNLIVSYLMKGKLFQRIKEDETTDIVDSWNKKLKTKCDSSDDLIVSLSGGNQQKVLIARALALNADIIILDDPTRGVDVTTKLELYEVLREAARAGKLVLWRTSDDAELVYCSKVVIMQQGSVKGVFTHTEFTHSEMLKIAFRNAGKKEGKTHTKRGGA